MNLSETFPLPGSEPIEKQENAVNPQRNLLFVSAHGIFFIQKNLPFNQGTVFFLF